MIDPKPEPGPGLFAGWQDAANDIPNRPPRPYLMHVPVEVAGRSRYQANMGVATWRGADLYLTFFVDPETRRVFGQPNDDESRRRERFAHDPEPMSFAEARELARWLALHAAYVNDKTPRLKVVPRLPAIWREYIEGQRGDAAPVALGLPARPDETFVDAGWMGWEDWFWEPRASAKRSKGEAKDEPG